MKASQKTRRRFVRAFAIAGAATALAVPAGASAMPIGPHNPAPMNYVQGSDQGSDGGAGMQQFGPGELTGGAADGARLDHRGLHNTAQDVWASSLVSRGTTQTSTFKTDIPAVVRASNAGAYVQMPSSTIREPKTVVQDDGRTLEIALAASALGIALCCAGYATIRLARIQRRLGTSH
jgi:hypothetical protein